MRKLLVPLLLEEFKRIFERINKEKGLNAANLSLISYRAHPGCPEEDMAELAGFGAKQMNFKLEQVQDFTPTPMTLSTEIYYTGIHPYTGRRALFAARKPEEKLNQRKYFFWYLPEKRNEHTKFTQTHAQKRFGGKTIWEHPVEKTDKNRK